MKILTLNTHSLQEENYAEKLEGFIERILVEQPDVVALQEVNQSLPSFMQVSRIEIRTSDFERTPSMKIVRYKKCN